MDRSALSVALGLAGLAVLLAFHAGALGTVQGTMTSGLFSVQVLNVTDQARQSDTVVTGTVTDVGDAQRSDGDHPVIRPVTVTVDRVLVGSPGGTVTIHVPGGEVGGYGYHVSTAAEFTAGEHVLLFLRTEGDHHVMTSGSPSKYVIAEDGLVHRDVPDDVEDDAGFRETINVTVLARELGR